MKIPNPKKLSLKRCSTISKRDDVELSGKLYFLTTYFNYMGTKSKFNNFCVFYHHMKKEGVNLLVGEVQLHDRAFELNGVVEKNELPIQIANGEMIWQKEAILNLLLKELPDDCDKVCWIDSDIIFQYPGIVLDISNALNQYKIVQCFENIIQLPKGLEFIDGLEVESFPKGFGDCHRMSSYIKRNIEEYGSIDEPAGYVWAARRSIFDECSFYENSIFGGADLLMAMATTFNQYHVNLGASFSRFHLHDYMKWAQRWCEEIGGSSSYIQQNIFHLYHGSMVNRGYSTRLATLKEEEYTPSIDVHKGTDGLIHLTDNGKKKFEEKSKQFFSSRQEDKP